jgi:peptidoglycan/LPS O-acetylase OafA/YrhL
MSPVQLLPPTGQRMSSTRKQRHAQRDTMSDVRWGIRYGLAVTAIALVPAVFVAVIQPTSVNWREVFEVLTGYLTFGACGGAIAGLARPILSKLWGAVVIGAVIGALGVTALTFFQAAGGRHDPGLFAFSMVFGACTGAVAGVMKHLRDKERRKQNAVAPRLD